MPYLGGGNDAELSLFVFFFFVVKNKIKGGLEKTKSIYMEWLVNIHVWLPFSMSDDFFFNVGPSLIGLLIFCVLISQHPNLSAESPI